jgi:hypothetical protein
VATAVKEMMISSVMGAVDVSPFRHPADCKAISQDPFEQVTPVWILRFGCAERSMTE